jgi:hypothetical protein
MVLKHGRGCAAKVFDWKRDSNRFFSHLAEHYRQRERKRVVIRCAVDIILGNGKLVNSGRASIRNLSASGALLSRFKLGKDILPAKPFRMKLHLLAKEFEGIIITCMPVRLEMDGGFGVGVRFQDISVRV